MMRVLLVCLAMLYGAYAQVLNCDPNKLKILVKNRISPSLDDLFEKKEVELLAVPKITGTDFDSASMVFYQPEGEVANATATTYSNKIVKDVYNMFLTQVDNKTISEEGYPNNQLKLNLVNVLFNEQILLTWACDSSVVLNLGIEVFIISAWQSQVSKDSYEQCKTFATGLFPSADFYELSYKYSS